MVLSFNNWVAAKLYVPLLALDAFWISFSWILVVFPKDSANFLVLWTSKLSSWKLTFLVWALYSLISTSWGFLNFLLILLTIFFILGFFLEKIKYKTKPIRINPITINIAEEIYAKQATINIVIKPPYAYGFA